MVQKRDSINPVEGLAVFKMVLNTLCFVLLLLTVFIPYWLKIKVSLTYLHMGLWKPCGDRICEDFLKSVLMKIVQVLMALATATGFLALVDIFLIMIHAAHNGTFLYLYSAVFNFATAFLGFVGNVIFMVGVNIMSITWENHFFFDWAFYLNWGTTLLYLLSGTVMLLRRYPNRVQPMKVPVFKGNPQKKPAPAHLR